MENADAAEYLKVFVGIGLLTNGIARPAGIPSTDRPGIGNRHSLHSNLGRTVIALYLGFAGGCVRLLVAPAPALVWK